MKLKTTLFLTLLVISVGLNVFQFFCWIDISLDSDSESMYRHHAEQKIGDLNDFILGQAPYIDRKMLEKDMKIIFPKDTIENDGLTLNWRNLYFHFDESGKLYEIE